ncbi:sulfatase-like hydrolase/transferase [Haloarcula sp. 1CSR25-25]|uniref:sulfatase-like hydrolase/transferase n=1 Tax=Haloarcula sp. 1CSR25-25 TaxID=2862545 RepID=UPI002895AB28|nr:sulfatase-like hydrolase/transferase [Haloarcula sp. 1CSR25-25]MDT3435556.1 sulfatase-like hydrolase/transferase [Haloarcula sp. 1CSR25-25]
MIEKIAKQTLDTFYGLKNRIVYETGDTDVPSITLEDSKNVLIITVDCLRNDRISRNGYQRNTTPFIDTLASYTPAIAAAPWTFSSVPSILTGLYPNSHGAAYSDDSARNQDLSNPPNGVRDDIFTIADLLDDDGYETKFITAIGTAAVPIEGRFKSMEQRHNADAETLLSEIQEWWNSKSDPKFGYVQLGDLHEPLQEPDDNYFGDIPDVEGINRWRFTSGRVNNQKFEEYRYARELLYDTLVRYIDEEIERTLDELAELNDTIIIVTSDHGEEFWEYRDFEETHFADPREIIGVGHGHALVPPVIDVPIVTNIENTPISETRRSLTDIVPTILDELGTDRSFDFDGYPLQKPIKEPVLSQEIAYGPNQISVTDGNKHLIYTPVSEESVLLNFNTGETINNSELKEQLLDYIPRERTTGSKVDISQDVQDRLSDLGYAE